MRALAPLVALACTPPDTLVAGEVLDAGAPVAGVEVHIGDRTVVTDTRGRFSATFPPGTATPVATVFPAPDRALSAWTCGDSLRLEVAPPAAPPTATLDLTLLGVRAPGRWDVRYATLEGTDRAPLAVVWPLDLATPTTPDDAPTTAVARWQVPAAARFALSLSRLVRKPYLGQERWLIDQYVLLQGTDLAPGSVRPVELLMSDETLREAHLYDGTGPPGAAVTRVYQEVARDPFAVDVLLWEGPGAAPAWMPSLHLAPSDPPGPYRAEFAFSRYDDCTARTVGTPLPLASGEVPTAWLGDPRDTGSTPIDHLAVPAPLPAPLSVSVTREPALEVAWTVLETGAGTLTAELEGPGGRWSVTGPQACAPDAVAWPLPVRTDAVVRGEVRWSAGGRWGRCDVRGL